MLIPPKYTINSKIISLLQEIENLKTKLIISSENELNISHKRQKSILKSSLYSARIEGNKLKQDEVSSEILNNPKEIEKIELANIYQTIEYILSKNWNKKISIEDIKQIHHKILLNISTNAGSFRSEQSAIFNQAGVVIYVCPPPQQIKPLLTDLLNYIHSNDEPITLIKAAVSHFSFEKIHPFLDGNGRVGRSLIHLILKKYNYDLGGMVAFEQYIDENKDTYYDYLSLSQKDITLFIKFILQAILNGLKRQVNSSSKTPIELSLEDKLPLRRFEILNIIKDHKFVSFDFIKRRFISTPERTLSYDLKKLQDVGLIKKRGATRGVIYESIKKDLI